MSGDHRQRGGKLGVCPDCRKFVYSNESSVLVAVFPATFRHTRHISEKSAPGAVQKP